jgi:hypothetical protein
MPFAPIILFVYNRPYHALKTLEGLMTNPEFSESLFYVYCDGPRQEKDIPAVQAVREAVRSRSSPNMVMVERETNIGLANSIIRGATTVCNKHGRAIVIEDDLLVSRHYLSYMNEAMDRYADCDQVMQVVGHCFPAPGYGQSSGSSFLPFTSSYGWGTWKRAWQYFDPDFTGYEQMLADATLRNRFNIRGAYSYTGMINKLRRKNQLNRSWAVRWYWSVFKRNGMTLFPHRTLVSNFGYDDSGTNCRGKQAPVDIEFAPENAVTELPTEVAVDEVFYAVVRRTISKQQTLWSKGIRYIKRWL